MREPILVINAGSSSIKFSVFETAADRALLAGAHGQVEGIGTSLYLEGADDKLTAPLQPRAMTPPSRLSTSGLPPASAVRRASRASATISSTVGSPIGFAAAVLT
jgi:hypothetical protein